MYPVGRWALLPASYDVDIDLYTNQHVYSYTVARCSTVLYDNILHTVPQYMGYLLLEKYIIAVLIVNNELIYGLPTSPANDLFKSVTQCVLQRD